MAVSKVILNGTTLMDVTDDTVVASKLLSGITATQSDGVEITGSIATKTASNLSANGKTVTVPAGYYASQATKDVATGTITNNTTLPSGKTSSGTVNRGSYIKIGAGYYNETYYQAQANSGTVTISASGDTSCDGKVTVSVPSATPAFDGGALSGGSTATGTNVTLSTTDNGMKVQTAYTASSGDVLYNGAVNGWVSKADNAVALAGQSKASTNGTAYYVTAVTMPKDKGFTVTTTADTALDTASDLDVTNNAYRRVDITNKANGTVLVANSGNSTVTSGSATAGNLTVSAYNASGTAENNKSIVSAGKWVATSVSASGTYYGRVTVGSGSVTQNAPTINTSTGVVTANSTVTAGYVAAATPSNTLSLSTQAAKTVTPTESEQTAVAAGKYTTGVVKVGAISSTYVGSGITQRTSTDLSASGKTVTVPAGYYATQATKDVATGTITNNTTLPSGTSSSGTVNRGSYIKISAGYYDADKYYLAQNVSNGTITNNTTLPSGSSSSGTINRGSYIKIGAGYYSADKYYLAQNVSNGTITNNTSGGTSSGTINMGSQIKIGAGYYASDAYYTAAAPSGNIQLTQATSTDVSAYATATVRGVTAAISGGTLSGTATASGSGVTISDSTNNSGVSISTACTASRTAVSCTASTAGWASGTIKTLDAGSTAMTAKTYYVNGVTLTKPSSGTRTFSVTVPNGSSTATFVFNVDTSGNVTITES